MPSLGLGKKKRLSLRFHGVIKKKPSIFKLKEPGQHCLLVHLNGEAQVQ